MLSALLATAAFFTPAPGAAPSAGGSAAHGGSGNPAGALPTRSFHSEPQLHPPVVSLRGDPDGASGDIFLTPTTARGGGLMILNSRGRLVWYDPVPRPVPFDLEVQSYRGRPVLTWSQDNQRTGNEDIIMNRSYRTVAVVRAGHGYVTDAHDFLIDGTGAAWLIATTSRNADLTSVHGPVDGTVHDCLIQKVDIRTGRVLWQWDAYRHIPLDASYSPPQADGYYDAYHLNSLQLLPDGNLLVSARNTWSVYKVSTRTGRILWTLGGKYSDFTSAPHVRFEWQHDARLRGNVLTLFNDADSPQEEAQSSAEVLDLNQPARKVRLIRRYTHTPPLLSSVEGSAQMLPNRHVFVGWGSAPDFSEYAPGGRQIFTASFALGVTSYRALRFPWSARPATPPDVAAAAAPHGRADVWASWNGATNVSRWRVLGGPRPHSLHALATRPDRSFETRIVLGTRPAYVQVQALGGRGKVLGSSTVQALR